MLEVFHDKSGTKIFRIFSFNFFFDAQEKTLLKPRDEKNDVNQRKRRNQDFLAQPFFMYTRHVHNIV